ncbi:ImmA/IrrE family metallo-endopeptidase [Candidatus Manganitrophus noduliformans]|uniref:ImmA/IrrE family metallo-endopeptidase n=1 Tax=Candidatus Manganitrophus noduliformans TaxID=2606439 RepID=A0A7X6ICW9_9BACT|nr:ImmA/IrrE family metallo-endopeptidase [Candidatus Manganitrophus noduliformans]NKE72981.1 ImmA/IrrE family metallo-endopeptidase [Candidatus Manganitrophus noduliformans]
MNKIKVIKTEKDYKEALELVEVLMDNNPSPESEEGEKLNLLATLIEDYETTVIPQSLPDPVDAILFRMEQANLKPADLIPYIGSRSKVSEVLSRKRPLTLSMMRALEAGLGIPAKVLLRESDEFRDPEQITWKNFPIKEMEKRGYFDKKSLKGRDINDLMESFFKPIGPPATILGLLRKSNYIRASRPMDKQALAAWSGYILKRGKEIAYPTIFKQNKINVSFMQQLAKLSADSKGSVLVFDVLKDIGIGLVVEPHFPKTYLDGAVFMTDRKHPVIGLTIRHDRLDNFWFTLMHELAHLALHFDQDINLFYDDLDNEDSSGVEIEADQLAREALVPESVWENSPAKLIPSPIAAESLAKELHIHPAVVAGKMRREGDQYQYLNTIISQAKVRKYFPEINWSK